MTAKKQLKNRIRARMARTGERYLVARSHVVGSTDTGPVTEFGWTLRGGTDPEAAALAGLLDHAGVRAGGERLDEALLFGIGGGIGAGYILWEFARHNSRVVVLGFTNRWQYLGSTTGKVADRLGIALTEHRTGGAKNAAAWLAAQLDAGRPCLVWPDRYHLGYWHVPAFLDGHGGHPVVAYARTGDRVRLDDRNLAPLTVPVADLDRARARVGSYRNAAFTVAQRDRELGAERLAAAVRAGLADVTEHLSARSDSFALPAWRKWSRLLVDTRNAKAWPKVFADRAGLLGALASVWEGIEPAGMTGGCRRGLFADFLDRAADVLDRPELAGQAASWRDIGAQWHQLAETALPAGVPTLDRLRTLTATVTSAVSDGDAGAAERAQAAAELWRLRAEHAENGPFGGPGSDDDQVLAVFTAMSGSLAELARAEEAAITALREYVGE